MSWLQQQSREVPDCKVPHAPLPAADFLAVLRPNAVGASKPSMASNVRCTVTVQAAACNVQEEVQTAVSRAASVGCADQQLVGGRWQGTDCQPGQCDKPAADP